MRRRSVAVLALSHLASDLGQGALPAMLPFFIAQRHFSYSVAAGLVMAISSTSSFLQPLFGWLADRRPSPWLAPAGLLVAGTSMAFAGIVSGYWWLIAALAVSGLGLAAFHPEGARLIRQVSGKQRGVAMSWFSVGGNLGFAIGPVVTTGILAWQGLRGSLLLILPTVVVACILIREIQGIKNAPHLAGLLNGPGDKNAEVDEWKPFALLGASVFCRSLVFFGLNTFLPLYWMHVFGSSKTMGNSALAVFLFSGVTGTLLGGKLGDAFPRHKVIAMCLSSSVPFLIALLLADKASTGTAILIPLGIALFAPYSVMVVLGQEYLPNRVGTASGVTIGLAGTVGGLGAPALGALADHFGLPAAFMALTALACVASALTFFLRPPRSQERVLRVEQIEVEI